jgi:glycerol-3-phosphate O-acyltransferase
VAISFDQIPEMDDYIAMQHGVPKRKESLKWFIDYIAGMKSNYGKVYVRFAEPISLSESVPVSNSPDASDNDSQGQKLAFEICNRIEHIIPITLTDLVTLVLLAANGRALDAEQIRKQAMDIVDLIERGGLPTAGDLHIHSVDELQTKLQSLTTTGLLQCFAKGATPVYLITPGRQLAAAYYRNTIVHYFLNGALAETALASTGLDPSGQSFLGALMRLRDLLKFEFTFKSKDVFQEEAVDFLDYRYPGWRGRGSTFPPGPPALFGQGILRSFVEAYWVLAGLLVKRGSQPISVENESALIDVCLARGEEMLLRKEITTEAALSGPLFATAMRLARYRELLDADDGQIRTRREQFASEVEQTLVAINELQDVYDQSLQEPAIRHVHEARSIA